MTKTETAILEFLKLSLGNDVRDPVAVSLSADEWNELVRKTFRLRIPAVAIDGYGKLGVGTTLDGVECDKLRFKWFNAAFKTEEDNRSKMRKAALLAAALKERGIGCMVLKGMSFATYYSEPFHRECGDCDIYLGDGFEAGDNVGVELGAMYEPGGYKHSHLYFGTLMVENHRYLTDFCGTRQGIRTERLMQKVIAEAPGRPIGDTSLLCPNDRFNALFLLWHAQMDFMMGGLYLKELYDWAALLGRCRTSLVWDRLYADLSECRLLKFTKLMTSLATEYLGVEPDWPEILRCTDTGLVEEVMKEIMSGGIRTRGRETFTKKCIRIFRRFHRMWHYRRLATESYPRMVWNCLTINSYTKRKIEI